MSYHDRIVGRCRGKYDSGAPQHQGKASSTESKHYLGLQLHISGVPDIVEHEEVKKIDNYS